MKIVFDTVDKADEFVAKLYDEQKFVINARHLPDSSGIEIQWIEHKPYKAHDGKEFFDEVWVTEDGEMKLIQDLEPEHARNVLRMLLRQERAARQVMNTLMENLVNIDEEDNTVATSVTQHVLH